MSIIRAHFNFQTFEQQEHNSLRTKITQRIEKRQYKFKDDFRDREEYSLVLRLYQNLELTEVKSNQNIYKPCLGEDSITLLKNVLFVNFFIRSQFTFTNRMHLTFKPKQESHVLLNATKRVQMEQA